MASTSDILGWTPESLAGRRVADLKALFDRVRAPLPERDDARRGQRRGLHSYAKSDYVLGLLDLQEQTRRQAPPQQDGAAQQHQGVGNGVPVPHQQQEGASPAPQLQDAQQQRDISPQAATGAASDTAQGSGSTSAPSSATASEAGPQLAPGHSSTGLQAPGSHSEAAESAGGILRNGGNTGQPSRPAPSATAQPQEAAGIKLHHFVKLNVDGGWHDAIVTAIGFLGDEPIFSARPVGSATEIRAIERSRLRDTAGVEPVRSTIHIDPIQAGDCVQRVSEQGDDAPVYSVIGVIPDPEQRHDRDRMQILRMGAALSFEAPRSELTRFEGCTRPQQRQRNDTEQQHRPAQQRQQQRPQQQPHQPQQQRGSRVPEQLLRQLNIGVNGNPGSHTDEGRQATQHIRLPGPANDSDPDGDVVSSPVRVPGGAGGGAQVDGGHAATWKEMFGDLSDYHARSLDDLDPSKMLNMRDGKGCLPELAQGRSLITPNRPVKPGDLLYTADFIPPPNGFDTEATDDAAQVGPFMIKAAAKPPPDPVSIGQWLLGASRLRQYCQDVGRPLAAEYDIYVQTIVQFDQEFTMAAINAYDKAFRRHLHYGEIKSWADWPQRLYSISFDLNPAARKHRRSGSGDSGGSSSGDGDDSGAKRAGKRQKTKLSTAKWANKTLKHKSVNGNALCFAKQRYGKCSYKSCTRDHDHCGMCGDQGHVATDCPTDKASP